MSDRVPRKGGTQKSLAPIDFSGSKTGGYMVLGSKFDWLQILSEMNRCEKAKAPATLEKGTV